MTKFARYALLSTALVAFNADFVEAATYVRGIPGNPETLDQHKTSTTVESVLLRDLYEGLVIKDASGEVIPGVAESWEVDEAGTTYTFHLREDAKWSNGDPVVAGDFVFSLRRILTPSTGAKYATILYDIENAEAINNGEMEPEELGVEAVDDRTLTITLNAPVPYFIELLTHQTSLPLHPATVEAEGSDFVQPGKMVSNGAFMLSENVLNDRIVMVKNPEFHAADEVMLDEVISKPIEDRPACVRAWEAEEVHACRDLPAEDLARLGESYGDALRVVPFLGTYYYAFNMEDEFLSDPEVRQALSMLVDREFLAEEIWRGAMIPATSFVPPGIGNYPTGSPAVDYFELGMLDREDMAAEILASKGVTPDTPVTIELMYNSSENHKNVATAVADMWSNFGVNVEFNVRDISAHYAHLRDRGDFDVARAGWIGDYSDPRNFLFLVESYNDGFNYARYNSAEYDQLMKDATAETDIEARSKILQAAEALFMRDLPFLPLLYYSSLSLVSPKLSGWEDNIDHVHPARFISITE